MSTLAQADRVDSVQVPRLRVKAQQQVAHALADAYETVHAAMAEPHNGYLADPLAGEALRHTPAQVRTILGIT